MFAPEKRIHQVVPEWVKGPAGLFVIALPAHNKARWRQNQGFLFL